MISSESVKTSTDDFSLFNNYPNPFNPATTITFNIVNKGIVRLTIHDLLGRSVATLLDEIREPGKYSVQWNATAVAGGTYFCRIVSGNYSGTKKLLLLK
jgi:hypothetical protein